MAEKTIKIVVDLPPSNFAFIGGECFYGGSELTISENDFDPRSSWMKRKYEPVKASSKTLKK